MRRTSTAASRPARRKVTFEVAQTDPKAMDGLAVFKLVLIHFGDKPDGPTVHLHLYLPAKAPGPVPLLLHLVFFNNAPIPGETSAGPGSRSTGVP